MPTVTGKISGGGKCTALNLRTFVPYTYAEIWHMDIRPIQNTLRPKDNMESYLYDIDYGQFFTKMSTVK